MVLDVSSFCLLLCLFVFYRIVLINKKMLQANSDITFEFESLWLIKVIK